MPDGAGSARPPARPSQLRIAGLAPFSSVDWPGRLVATVFLQGCPWNCFYCHNPALIDPRRAGAVSWDDVTSFLETRRGLLDGVVISGGEPTMQRALVPALRDLRERGMTVGLHSAGPYPRLLARALPLVDWVGLDIKATAAEYPSVSGRAGGEKAWRSLELVLAQAELRRGTPHPLDYEIRTTAHPSVTDDDRLERLGNELADRGACVWTVQRARETGTRMPHARPGEGSPPASLALDRLPARRFARLTVR